MSGSTPSEQSDHLLAVYLRDHFAGAVAGLALATRSQRANADTPLGAVLADIVDEIAADRDSLREIMEALHVTPDPVKAALGKAAEVAGRLKSNGIVTHYSPSSRVVELEGLLAGIDAKRNLWRSLRAATAIRAELDVASLDALIERATAQRDRLQTEHDRAAQTAFASA